MPLRRPLLILLFLSISYVYAEATCGLACWVSQIQLNIPDQNFTFGMIDAQVKHIRCSSIRIQNIDSHEANDTLHVTVGGLGIECSLGWSVHGNNSFFPIQDNGELEVGIDPTQSSTDMSLSFQRNTSGLVKNITLHRCKTSISLNPIHSQGGFFAGLLDIFSMTVTPMINFAIDSQLCPIIEEVVKNNLTDAYKLLGQEFLKPNLPLKSPRIQEEDHLFSNLTSSPLLALGNLFSANYTSKNPFGLNGLFNFMTHETGTLNLTKLHHILDNITVEAEKIGRVRIGLNSGSIGGLNEWNNVDLMVPLSFYRRHVNDSHYLSDYNATRVIDSMLISDIQMKKLTIALTLSMEINVTSPFFTNVVPLQDEISIQLSVSDVHIHADILALVLQKKIDSLTGDAFQNPEELLQIFETLNTTFISSNFTVDEMKISTIHMDWEAGVTDLFNDVIHVSIQKVLPKLINSAMGSIVRGQANTLLQNFLHHNNASVRSTMEEFISREEKENREESQSKHHDLKMHPETLGLNVFWTVTGVITMSIVFILLSVVSLALDRGFMEDDGSKYN